MKSSFKKMKFCRQMDNFTRLKNIFLKRKKPWVNLSPQSAEAWKSVLGTASVPG